MRQCIERLLSPELRAFDAKMWQEDPLEGLGGENGHAAYLGYLNLLLGLHRLAGGSAYADLNDRITAALIRRLTASPIKLAETYPDEIYPVDNCFVIGSIGLHQAATGSDHRELIRDWVEHARRRYVDPKSGLLIQAVNRHDGSAADAPRGSGTALGVLAVYYADPAFARELYGGIKQTLAAAWFGFGAVREYPPGSKERGDIDSGPIILGYGLSATGFAIAGARMHRDHDYFRNLFATAHLFGAPFDRGDGREYLSGGPLGNAILFAMLTAPKAGS
jgi:hypothetical protein